MKILALAIAIITATTACSTSPSSEISEIQLTGTASFACGVTDGAASKIILAPSDAPNSHYYVFVHDHIPENLKGSYEINSKYYNTSTANLDYCSDETPPSCARAESGTLTVTSNAWRVVRGTLSFKTEQGGTVVYPYSAKIVPPPPNTFCG